MSCLFRAAHQGLSARPPTSWPMRTAPAGGQRGRGATPPRANSEPLGRKREEAACLATRRVVVPALPSPCLVPALPSPCLLLARRPVYERMVGDSRSEEHTV